MNRKNWFLLMSILLLALALAGCQRGSSTDIPEIGLELTVSPDPPGIGQATIMLVMAGEDGQPITGAQVELEGNMSHAGMTPVFSQAREVDEGRYEAPLEFTMGGDWFILVKATLPDGRKMERQVDVPGVAAQ